MLDWYSCIPTFLLEFFLESLSWVVSKTLRALSLLKSSFHVLPVRNVTPNNSIYLFILTSKQRRRKTAVCPQE